MSATALAPAAAWRRHRDAVRSHLLVALACTLPLPPPASNVAAGLLLAAWLLGGSWREGWRTLWASPVVRAAAAFLALHAAGLAWTEHLREGLAVLQKEWKFLLLPVCMACARPEHLERYLAAFVCAMGLASMLSFSIWLGALPPFNDATVANPVPFGTHVVYGPLLALAVYLAGRRALFDRQLAGRWRAALTLLAVVMAMAAFLTIGRAGQAGVCVAIALLCWQGLGRGWVAALAAAALVAGTLALAFAASESFRARSLAAATGDAHLGGGYDISIDERRAYSRNAAAVVAEHPLLGVGTGDLGPEMRRAHDARGSDVRFSANPHSMYLAVAGRFGALGLACLGWLFWVQLRTARAQGHGTAERQAGEALPILFAVLCLAESYLALHATALAFCVFSGILYPPQTPPKPSASVAGGR